MFAAAVAGAAAMLGLLVGVAPAQAANFSQDDGFRAYFAAHPPADRLPTAGERALLRRHRPRLYLPAGHEGPLDFYADYIASGVLYDADGLAVAEDPPAALLDRYKDRPEAVFVHRPGAGPVTARAYGRVDRLDLPAPMTFLTYHFVFRSSGLPAGLSWWQRTAVSLLGDLDDWHQLDHYTAVSVVLDGDARPFAVVMQQHNYLRTHLLGERLTWPEDGRVRLDVAVRSNELYPHHPERMRRPAVRFLSYADWSYMMGQAPRPWLAADDITDPEREADYDLAHLRPDDAFYNFQGYLGARRLLPGRDGPPGAAYNIWPALKPLHLQLASGYWRPGHDGDLQRGRTAHADADDWRLGFARAQLGVLLHNAHCLRTAGAGCALQ